MSKARIKLVGNDINKINSFINEVKFITEKLGVNLSGPIPLPTKILRVNVRKSPNGGGKASFERYQMRIHKRLLDVDLEERALRKIMKIKIPSGVNIEIKLIE